MVLRVLAELMLPPRCAACDAFGASPLCAACESGVEWIDGDACMRCASPKRDRTHAACVVCEGRELGFGAAASAVRYDGPARDAIVAFKALGERRFARAFARWLLVPARRLANPDVITWVPSTKRAAAERGFVPAGEVARAFARATGRRATSLLEKTRDTTDQHELGAEQRFSNQSGAYEARPRFARDGVVLLVDDVLTTGATAGACANALRAAGAARVELLTVARAELRKPGSEKTARIPYFRAPSRGLE